MISRCNLIFVAALVTLGTSGTVQAQLQPSWTRGYGPPNAGTFAGLARDVDDNVFALVDSFGEFSILKYSPTGASLWTNRYNSPLQDIAGGVAAGPDGSVLVAGVSSTNSQTGHLVVLKYAPDGASLWTRNGDATGVTASASSALAIATESAGNAFVAATSPTGFLMMKYGPGGSPLWTTHHPIEANSFASLKRLAIDAAGAMIVVGESRSATASSLILLKRTASGELTLSSVQPWADSQDFLTAAAVDPDGNVYVAASVRRPAPWLRYHLFAAKYDADGVLKWSQLRAPIEGYHAISHDIEFDREGNVILTGHEVHPVSEDEDQVQTLIIKYDAAGRELWSARSGFDRTPRGLVVDVTGAIHVATTDRSSAGNAVILLKYLPDGNQVGQTSLAGSHVQRMMGGNPGELHLAVGPELETLKFRDVPIPSQPTAVVSPGLSTVPRGSNVTLTAAVAGTGPHQMQWFRLGYQLPGQTNATLTLTNLSVWGLSPYTVRVTNEVGYAVSPEAHVAVAPSIVVSRLPDRLRLEWEPSTGFRLESTDSLLGGTWTPIPLGLSVNWHEVLPEAPTAYFRLAR